jgi:hypothetical protein
MKRWSQPCSMRLPFLLAMSVIAGVMGCMSVREHPILDAIREANQPPKFYSEAFIEYPGPQERWAGPASWTLHVKASEPPEITLSPARQKNPGVNASFSTEQIKEKLAKLASLLEADAPAFSSCLSPIRVRLIRADSTVTERRGCRQQSTWSSEVSRITDELIAAARNPSPPTGNPSAKPAAVVVSESNSKQTPLPVVSPEPRVPASQPSENPGKLKH